MCRQQSRLDGGSKLVAHTDFGYQTFDAYFICIKSLFLFFTTYKRMLKKERRLFEWN